MAQQTAMQTLIAWGDEMLLKHPQKILSFGEAIDKAVELLQIEKEQIITAASIGILWGEDEEQLQSSVKFGEEYYDRTFTSIPQGENPSATETEQS